MGLVQQEWVGQSRGKMPLPRFYWQPWERHLARGSGVPPRFIAYRGGTPLPRKALPRVGTL